MNLLEGWSVLFLGFDSCCWVSFKFSNVSDPDFFPDPDRTFFSESGSAKNPDRPKIRIQIYKKRLKNVSTSRKIVYFIFGTLNTVLFGQVPPKPSQNHHLNDISLLMDGSVSGFLKSGSGSAKKPGSIRI